MVASSAALGRRERWQKRKPEMDAMITKTGMVMPILTLAPVLRLRLEVDIGVFVELDAVVEEVDKGVEADVEEVDKEIEDDVEEVDNGVVDDVELAVEEVGEVMLKSWL